MDWLEPPVFRPPSEARSLILQATLGCSWNRCTFCGSYLGKRFRVKPLDQFRREVEQLASMGYRPRRIFLADGDAMVLPTPHLLRILRLLRRHFPRLERVGIYASAMNLKRKTVNELRQLREEGLGIAYMGLESGDDEVLRRVRKGATSQDHIDACQRLKEAGIALSLIVILGLGGKERSREHAEETARVVNAIDPQYLAALTLILVPRTELHAQAQRGEFHPLAPLDTLRELRLMIKGLTKLTSCLFRTNHASNYLPLGGVLSRDRERLLEAIDRVLSNPTALRLLRPEYLRGL